MTLSNEIIDIILIVALYISIGILIMFALRKGKPDSELKRTGSKIIFVILWPLWLGFGLFVVSCILALAFVHLLLALFVGGR